MFFSMNIVCDIGLKFSIDNIYQLLSHMVSHN